MRHVKARTTIASICSIGVVIDVVYNFSVNIQCSAIRLHINSAVRDFIVMDISVGTNHALVESIRFRAAIHINTESIVLLYPGDLTIHIEVGPIVAKHCDSFNTGSASVDTRASRHDELTF